MSDDSLCFLFACITSNSGIAVLGNLFNLTNVTHDKPKELLSTLKISEIITQFNQCRFLIDVHHPHQQTGADYQGTKDIERLMSGDTY